jgi:arsenate reductase (thioredoxin)
MCYSRPRSCSSSRAAWTSASRRLVSAWRRSSVLTPELAQQGDIVVTMGCGNQCRSSPGKRYIDWELPDPAGQPIDQVRKIRDEISRRTQQLAEDL